MRRTVFSLIVCLTGFLSSALQADQVVLKNGDRLTGKIVDSVAGKLTFKSDLVGQVTINLKDIQTFSSDTPLAIHLKDGTVLHQPVTAAEPNGFAISQGEPLRPQTFPLSEVASINPPPKPEPKWTGSISGAVTAVRGNTRADSITASVSAARRTDADRTTAGVDYGKSTQTDRDTKQDTTTEDWWRARAQYDYFFTKKAFGFVNGRYEKDAVAELDRRIVVGGGGGYQWIETDATSFSTGFGLASLYEKFDNQTDSNSKMSLQAGYNLDKQLHKNLRLVHDLTYYPSLDKFSDYFLTSTAELRATLTKTMFTNFKVIFSYDATPAIDQGHTDVKYLLGVGINF
jgi:putative salt-induced outer membrane protein YdiY